MDNKLLSEQCVEYCKLMESLNETEEKIENKILDIIQLYDHHAYLINSYFLYDDEFLTVNYKVSYLGDSDRDTAFVRIKWLDLKNSEIKKLIEAQKEESKKNYENKKKKKDVKRKLKKTNV